MELNKNGNFTKKEVGKVSPEEKDEILDLFERKNGLLELSKSLSGLSKNELENNNLYEKVTTDLGRVNIKFQSWWDRMNKKYQWESIPGFRWEIDFDNCKIYLVKQ